MPQSKLQRSKNTARLEFEQTGKIAADPVQIDKPPATGTSSPIFGTAIQRSWKRNLQEAGASSVDPPSPKRILTFVPVHTVASTSSEKSKKLARTASPPQPATIVTPASIVALTSGTDSADERDALAAHCYESRCTGCNHCKSTDWNIQQKFVKNISATLEALKDAVTYAHAAHISAKLARNQLCDHAFYKSASTPSIEFCPSCGFSRRVHGN
jgi:hypothetical protein